MRILPPILTNPNQPTKRRQYEFRANPRVIVTKNMYLALALVCVFLLQGCGSHNEGLSHGAAPRSTPHAFVGSWENSIRSDGVVFWDSGRGVFYNEHHICPTYWASYRVRGHTLIASDLNHHAPSRTMYLGANGLLRERGTTIVYHRVKAVEFPQSPGHC